MDAKDVKIGKVVFYDSDKSKRDPWYPPRGTVGVLDEDNSSSPMVVWRNWIPPVQPIGERDGKKFTCVSASHLQPAEIEVGDTVRMTCPCHNGWEVTVTGDNGEWCDLCASDGFSMSPTCKHHLELIRKSKKEAPMSKRPEVFAVGDRVADPMHGNGKIVMEHKGELIAQFSSQLVTYSMDGKRDGAQLAKREPKRCDKSDAPEIKVGDWVEVVRLAGSHFPVIKVGERYRIEKIYPTWGNPYVINGKTCVSASEIKPCLAPTVTFTKSDLDKLAGGKPWKLDADGLVVEGGKQCPAQRFGLS